MNRARVGILILVGLLVAVGGYYGYGRFSAPTTAAATRSQLAEVRRGSLVATVSTIGNVVPAVQSRVSFKSGGRLKELNVKVGDAVKQGHALASLDTTDLEFSLAQAQSSLNTNKLKLQQLTTPAKSEELAVARASYESALAKYNQLLAGPSQDEITVARAALEKSQLALQKAQADYDRIAWRGDLGMRPEAMALQQATIDYNSALAAYNQKMAGPTQDQLKSAEASVYSTKKALEDKMQGPSEIDIALVQEQVKQAENSYRQAGLNLDGAILKAPFDGVVLSTGANPGEQVGASSAVVVLVDPASVRVDVTVDEMDVPKIARGQRVSFTLDALPNAQLTGKVTAVAPSATIQQGVATYPVSIAVDAADAAVLKGGMTVGASIVVERRENVLLVPNRAVRTTGRNRWVEVSIDGKTEQRQVKSGMSNDQNTEIMTGLEEGEQVIIPTTTTTPVRIGGMGGR